LIQTDKAAWCSVHDVVMWRLEERHSSGGAAAALCKPFKTVHCQQNSQPQP